MDGAAHGLRRGQSRPEAHRRGAALMVGTPGGQVVAARGHRVHRGGPQDVGGQVLQEGPARPLLRPEGPVTDRVETQVGSDTVSASAVVDAPPSAVFDFIRRPANHATISGDSSVKGTVSGPETLSLGDRFGMNMKI